MGGGRGTMSQTASLKYITHSSRLGRSNISTFFPRTHANKGRVMNGSLGSSVRSGGEPFQHCLLYTT